MTAYLGVSRNRTLLQLASGSKSFWCVYGSSNAEVGDVLLLHFPGRGISQVYRITAIEGIKTKYACAERGMATVETTLLTGVPNPISVADMKAHPIIKDMGAVKRNFQMTTFKVGAQELSAIVTLILQKNPDLNECLSVYVVNGQPKRESL